MPPWRHHDDGTLTNGRWTIRKDPPERLLAIGVPFFMPWVLYDEHVFVKRFPNTDQAIAYVTKP